jgi:CHASE3 domain sensor protein
MITFIWVTNCLEIDASDNEQPREIHNNVRACRTHVCTFISKYKKYIINRNNIFCYRYG